MTSLWAQTSIFNDENGKKSLQTRRNCRFLEQKKLQGKERKQKLAFLPSPWLTHSFKVQNQGSYMNNPPFVVTIPIVKRTITIYELGPEVVRISKNLYRTNLDRIIQKLKQNFKPPEKFYNFPVCDIILVENIDN